MKEKRNLLIGILLSGILGWTLGFLRLPYFEKNFSFWLGFVACLSFVLLGLLIIYVWKKNALVSNLFKENSSTPNTFKKNIFLSILTLSFILIGGFTSSFLFFQQKNFSKIQTQQLHKKLAEQFELEATTRKSNSLILMNNLFDKIDAELKNNPNRILSDEMIERIAALNYSFEPYQYFDGEKFSERKWSPERGQLLLSLAKMNIDSISFNQLKLKTSFVGADLSGAKLGGADLSGANLRNANLSNADLSEANLNKADLKEANLWGTNLRKAKLRKADLKNAKMEWAEMNEADLYGADLNWVDLTAAKMEGVDSRGVNFEWAKMTGAFLNNANFSNANLAGADLGRANLSNAILKKANLKWTNLSEANLTKTDFSGANFNRTAIDTENWFEKLKEWKVIGIKEIQETYKIVDDYSHEYNYRLMYIEE